MRYVPYKRTKPRSTAVANVTEALAFILGLAIILGIFLYVLPARADGPRDRGDWACPPACRQRPETGPWGIGYPGYLPGMQAITITPGVAPLVIPQVPSPVQIVTVTVVVSQVVPTAPAPMPLPPAPPTPAPTPTATPAPMPPPLPPPPLPPAPTPTAVQGPSALQAPALAPAQPAIQPVTCSQYGCGLGDAPTGVTLDTYSAPREDLCTQRIVTRESGGDYGAVNPSSGAYGKYQLLPHGGVYDEYASAHGTDSYSTPVTTLTPNEQEAVYDWALSQPAIGLSPWGGCPSSHVRPLMR